LFTFTFNVLATEAMPDVYMIFHEISYH